MNSTTAPKPIYALDIAGNLVPLDKSVVSNMSQKQIEQLTQYIATIKTYEPGTTITPVVSTMVGK